MTENRRSLKELAGAGRLADAVDEACCSREGDWLAPFAEGDKLRKFRFFSKKS